jgi:hypothetical protein
MTNHYAIKKQRASSKNETVMSAGVLRTINTGVSGATGIAIIPPLSGVTDPQVGISQGTNIYEIHLTPSDTAVLDNTLPVVGVVGGLDDVDYNPRNDMFYGATPSNGVVKINRTTGQATTILPANGALTVKVVNLENYDFDLLMVANSQTWFYKLDKVTGDIVDGGNPHFVEFNNTFDMQGMALYDGGGVVTAARSAQGIPVNDFYFHPELGINPSGSIQGDVMPTLPDCTPPEYFDADGDCDIDMVDFAALEDCLEGPGYSVTTADPSCEPFDADEDNDVDLRDFKEFMKVYGTTTSN